MAQEFLHGADVGTRFQEVRGEAVLESVTGGSLRQTGLNDRPLDGALQHVLVKMMSIPRPTFIRRMTATCRLGLKRPYVPCPIR